MVFEDSPLVDFIIANTAVEDLLLLLCIPDVQSSNLALDTAT
jgi:hypothetical protein